MSIKQRLLKFLRGKEKPKGIQTYARKVKTVYPDATSPNPQGGARKTPDVIYLPPNKSKPKKEVEKLFPCPLFYRATIEQCKGQPPYSKCPYYKNGKCTHPNKKSYSDVLREAFFPQEIEVT